MNRLVLSLQQSITSRALILAVPSRTSSSVASRAVPKSDHDSPDSVKPFSAIPGPKPSPVVRNLLEFRRNSKRINKFLEECYRKYGEVFKLETPGKINFNLIEVFTAVDSSLHRFSIIYVCEQKGCSLGSLFSPVYTY